MGGRLVGAGRLRAPAWPGACVDVAVLGAKFDALRGDNQAKDRSAAALKPLSVALLVMDRRPRD